MRDIDEPAGQKIVNLISQRYITPGKQLDPPRRSYGYPTLDRNVISLTFDSCRSKGYIKE